MSGNHRVALLGSALSALAWSGLVAVLLRAQLPPLPPPGADPADARQSLPPRRCPAGREHWLESDEDGRRYTCFECGAILSPDPEPSHCRYRER